ncbi:uncharacterized protein LOC131674125 [Phymastichus coffea]|uniref:uncharacterized protein LOC131674125 n=1 Tax=Phymastichus coffea TaxID=108790 RepID=UPI00273C2D04|nr:uncharacterized protein LOC131674125 [Phymastichus coffea]
MELIPVQRELGKAIRRIAEKVADMPTASWTLGAIETRLDLLEGYWNNLNGNHGRLLTSSEAGVLEYLAGNDYAVAEELFMESKSTLLDHHVRCIASEDRSTLTATSSEAASDPTVPAVKLPRLSIPTFSGKPEDWESFRDLFLDLVHNNSTLGIAMKMNYLKTHVEGVAKDALAPFRSVNGDYAQAWKALCRRYDQPRLQVKDHLAALVKLTPIAEESPESLQTLLDELNKRRTQLERLGRPVEAWGDWFVYMGCRALDSVTMRAWDEHIEQQAHNAELSKVEATFEEFAEFLQRRYCTLRALSQTLSTSSHSPAEKRKFSRPADTLTIRAHATGASRVKGGCPACKEAHYIGHCFTFRGLDPEERRKLVAARGLCYNCLSGSHTARNCPSSGTCRSCSGAHHTLIHEGAGRSRRGEEEPRPSTSGETPTTQLQTAATGAPSPRDDGSA